MNDRDYWDNLFEIGQDLANQGLGKGGVKMRRPTEHEIFKGFLGILICGIIAATAAFAGLVSYLR